MRRYVLRDLVRNPRRTLASVSGIALAVGLFASISFFVDSSSAQMTARAIAPVKLDMQAGLTNPLASPLSLSETSAGGGAALHAGDRLTVTLTVRNKGGQQANAVKLTDTLAPGLSYVPATTTRDGRPLADAGDSSAPFPLAGGLSLGAIAPGTSTVITYMVTASAPTRFIAAATVQAAGDPTPVAANAPPPATLDQVIANIRALKGVSGAAPLASVTLPVGALPGAGSPLQLLAFDPAYLQTFPLVQVTAGTYTPGTVMLSQAAADLTRVKPGQPLTIALPGQAAPLVVTTGAIGDFTNATPLFISRSPDTQGEFVASPYIAVVDIATFQSVVLPAVRADAASASPVLKSPPVIEVDTALARSALASDPSTALVTTQGLRRTIERSAPGDITVTDNLSDALTAARTDSILAKVLFIFLGLPGVALAAYLSRYAGGLLAEAQRRERATLRARGVSPRALLRALAVSTALLAALGSILGLALGFAALALLFGGLQGDTGAYLFSIGLAVAAAAVTTGLALYLPARRSLLAEISEERRELEGAARPGWLRYRVDVALLVGAAVVGLVTYLAGGYKPAASAEGQSVSLSFYVLLAPAFLWIGATLLAVRGLLALSARIGRRRTATGFRRRLVGRFVLLSVLRRPRAAASGVIALSLAIAFGLSVSLFVTTYQHEKLADARFVNGADVKVTPSGGQTQPQDFAHLLAVPGVLHTSAAITTTSALVGTDKRALAAIDPVTFPSVATISPKFFTGMTPDQAIAALAADPTAVLIDTEVARTFSVQVGDQVRVQLPNPITGRPVPATFHAVAIFTSFPGFPQGIDIVGSIAGYQAVAPTSPNVYWLDTGGSDSAAAQVAAELRSGPGRMTPLLIDTIGTAVNRDQSTLAALNIDGLGRLEGLYTILLSALGIAIFVFGILLRRRKEHITLRALGLRMRHLVTLVVGEAAIVAIASIVIGGVVGVAMALLFVQILQPLFTIPPEGVAVAPLGVSLLIGLTLVATIVASLAAGASLRRAHLVDVLREE